MATKKVTVASKPIPKPIPVVTAPVVFAEAEIVLSGDVSISSDARMCVFCHGLTKIIVGGKAICVKCVEEQVSKSLLKMKVA